MRPFLIICLLAFLQVAAFGQRQLMLKSNPLYLLVPQRSTMPVGLEYSLGNFSVQVEQMLMLRKRTNLGVERNIRYFRSNAQLRYYFDFSERKNKGYFGVHGTVRDHTYFRTFGSYIRAGGETGNYRNSRINATNRAFYLISGVQHSIGPELSVEFTAGLGARRLSVRHDPESFEPGPIDALLTEDFEENWREGSRVLPALLLQFRFNYILFRK